MENLLKQGRYLYAAAFIAFGALQLITGLFVICRAPSWDFLMVAAPGWAYLTGVFFIICGAAIFANRKAQAAASAIGVLILLVPVIRYVPVVIADHNFGGDWTNFFKSIALAGGSFIVANSLPHDKLKGLPGLTTIATRLAPYGRFMIAAFFIVGGIQHFMFADFVKFLVPGWIPGSLFWTYFAGVALILAGIGLLVPKTVHIAALVSGLMIFTWMIILHLPRALAGPDYSEWLGVFETMAFSGILFVLAKRKG